LILHNNMALSPFEYPSASEEVSISGGTKAIEKKN